MKTLVLLSLCFSLFFFCYGYLPPAITGACIVPIVLKCSNLSHSNNYGHIAFANIISKVFESVILLKCETVFTCNNQFGFKPHNTDLCISFVETMY